MTLAWDTETALIEKGRQAPPLACLSYAYRDGPSIQTHLSHHRDGSAAFYALARTSLDQGRPLVGANTAFDMAVMMAHDARLIPYVFELYDRGLVRDVLIREKLINIAAGEAEYRHGQKLSYNLAEVVKRHTGFELAKDDTWRLRYGELIPLPLYEWPKAAQDYPIDDAVAPLIVYEAQEAWKDLLHDEIARTRTDFALRLASCYGLLLDPARVMGFEAGVQSKIGAIQNRLQAAGLVRANGSRDTKQAAALVVSLMGEAAAKTDKGNVILAEDTIRAIGHPALNDYADFSSLKKVLSTDIPILREGLIHSHFDALKETGRTGSSAPNVQNWTRDLDDDTWY